MTTARTSWGWGAVGLCGFSPARAEPNPAGGTILDTIVDRTRADLESSKKRFPESRLVRHAERRPPCRDFAAALRRQPTEPPRVIAELKRASPSRGVIRRNFGVISLSRELVEHGAAALSVLTEVHYFRGSPRYLQAVATSVSVPVLRKDFIVDAYQIYESRAWGADAVLLIAAALHASQFLELHELARQVGLAVLAEVHNRQELRMVLDAGAEIVGINSRDLRTFKTSLATTAELLAEVPEDVVKVAESGVKTAADIASLSRAGAHAFLVGETLMAAASPGQALDGLIGAPGGE